MVLNVSEHGFQPNLLDFDNIYFQFILELL